MCQRSKEPVRKKPPCEYSSYVSLRALAGAVSQISRTPARSLRDIVLVIAARPNFMKVAPILRALAAYPVRTHLVHTGQHYDDSMSAIFLQQLGLPEPDRHLGIGSGTHGAQTARALELFEQYLLEFAPAPAGVVVVGDVNSTFACAFAATKLGIPVAHVEAGLRSFDRSMPEEKNRIATDAISDLLFVSEPSGIGNLAREGISSEKIHFAGNVMIDTLVRELPAASGLNLAALAGETVQTYALATLHRPANVDNRAKLRAIADFLLRASELLEIAFPIHPRTRAKLEEFKLLPLLERSRRIRLLDPLGYRENLALMSQAKVVLTDSGGIQEETSFLRVPCLTLRANTERPVTVTHGTNTIVGDDLEKAYTLVTQIVAGRYKKGSPIPLWDGRAAERIAATLVESWADQRLDACEIGTAGRRDERLVPVLAG